MYVYVCIVWPKDIADDPASFVVDAIETIKWKPQIVPVIRIVSKFFETTGVIGTICTMMWTPGFRASSHEPGWQDWVGFKISPYL